MSRFIDQSGNAWTIEITIGQAKRVKRQFQVDLLDLEGGLGMARLGDDIYLFSDVVFCLVQQQAAERTINAEQFSDLLDGDTLLAAVDALQDAITDFFRKTAPRDGAVLEKLLAKTREAEKRLQQKQVDMMNDKFDQQMDELIDRELSQANESLAKAFQSTSGDESTKSPASSV